MPTIPKPSPAVLDWIASQHPDVKAPAKRAADTLTAAPRRLVLEVDVPIRTASEANARGKLRAKIVRKSAVKEAVAAALPAMTFPLPATVLLIRGGAKALDAEDNLPRALKAVKDVVATWLGLPSDRDPRVKWRFKQVPAWVPYERIRVTSNGEAL